MSEVWNKVYNSDFALLSFNHMRVTTNSVDIDDFIGELIKTKRFSEQDACRYIEMAEQSGDIKIERYPFYERATSESLRFLGFPPLIN
jgi:hypothetical protein